MIHRSLGPSLLGALVFALTAGTTEPAWACLTTTCAADNPPAGCARDPATDCWLAGAPLQWREPCVSFSVDARGIPPLDLGHSEAESVVVSAFALWLSTECGDAFPSIAVRSRDALDCVQVEYNSEGPNSNAVIFQTERWPHDPSAIGVTTVSFDPDSGRIVDADIEVNLTGRGLDVLGVTYVLTHESGHFFGIDHSPDTQAVMYAQSSFTSFDAPPVLAPDDETAICLAYPPDRTVGECDFEPEKGYSAVCGGDIEASCSVRSVASRSAGAPRVALIFAALGALLATQKRLRRRGIRFGMLRPWRATPKH